MKDVSDYFWETGQPKKCPTCDGTSFYDANIQFIEHYISEYDVHCTWCGLHVGFYAYGSWYPEFKNHFEEI